MEQTNLEIAFAAVHTFVTDAASAVKREDLFSARFLVSEAQRYLSVAAALLKRGGA